MSGKRELLLNAVEEMLNGNISERSGICENLLTKVGILGYSCVGRMSESWVHFSGDESYPISGRYVWSSYYDKGKLWEGEQRELRFSLLEHLKSELLKRTDEEVEELLS